jgi:hypothetical protein
MIVPVISGFADPNALCKAHLHRVHPARAGGAKAQAADQVVLWRAVALGRSDLAIP